MEQEGIDYYQLANIYLNKAQNCCQLSQQHKEGLCPLFTETSPLIGMVGDINRITDDGNTEAHQKYKHKRHGAQLSCQNYNRNNQRRPQDKYRRSILSSSKRPLPIFNNQLPSYSSSYTALRCAKYQKSAMSTSQATTN